MLLVGAALLAMAARVLGRADGTAAEGRLSQSALVCGLAAVAIHVALEHRLGSSESLTPRAFVAAHPALAIVLGVAAAIWVLARRSSSR